MEILKIKSDREFTIMDEVDTILNNNNFLDSLLINIAKEIEEEFAKWKTLKQYNKHSLEFRKAHRVKYKLLDKYISLLIEKGECSIKLLNILKESSFSQESKVVDISSMYNCLGYEEDLSQIEKVLREVLNLLAKFSEEDCILQNVNIYLDDFNISSLEDNIIFKVLYEDIHRVFSFILNSKELESFDKICRKWFNK